jgi:hypothetical protein
MSRNARGEKQLTLAAATLGSFVVNNAAARIGGLVVLPADLVNT